MTFYADKRTADITRGKRVRGVPSEVADRAARQIDILWAAATLDDARFAGHGRIAKTPGAKPSLDSTCMFTHSGGLGFSGNDGMPMTSSLRRKNGSGDVRSAGGDRQPTPPGEILRDEFLKTHGITQDHLAEAMGVSRFRVNEVINGRRGITAETALLLAAALGTTPEFWLNLQRAVDLYRARVRLSSEMERIKPVIRKPSAKAIFYDISE